MTLIPIGRCARSVASLIFLLALAVPPGEGQELMREEKPSAVLFKNVRVFDGKSSELSPQGNVLVVGNRISSVGREATQPPGGADLVEIDGGGRVLMPGLIDAHCHLFLGPPMQQLHEAAPGYLHAAATRHAHDMLMRGFTTIRDACGPVFGLKQAIDEGLVPGPRVYASGAMIMQTSGHFDYRKPYEPSLRFGGALTRWERDGTARIVNGVPEMLDAVREQLRLGAAQIKLAAGGSITGKFDPLDTLAFTNDELRAAVEAADNYGTYVMAHIYTSEGVRRALNAGVRSIEHGQLLDEPTMALLAEKGAWLSTQAFVADQLPAGLDAANKAKYEQVAQGTDRMFRLAKKYKVKLAYGTDKMAGFENLPRQSSDLVLWTRWFTPAQVLRIATSDNAELLKMSGKRNPYPDAALGVIEPGAYADLLLVDGNPLEDIHVLADPARHLLVIMKDGKIYKNQLR